MSDLDQLQGESVSESTSSEQDSSTESTETVTEGSSSPPDVTKSDSEVKPVTPTEEKEERFRSAARRERAAKAEQDRLNSEREQLKEKLALVEKYEKIKDSWHDDAEGLAEFLGADVDKLFEAAMKTINKQSTKKFNPVEEAQAKLEKKLLQMESERLEEKKQAQAWFEDQSKKSTISEAKQFVKENSEKYELLAFDGTYELVWNKLKESNGSLTLEQAVDEVESDLESYAPDYIEDLEYQAEQVSKQLKTVQDSITKIKSLKKILAKSGNVSGAKEAQVVIEKLEEKVEELQETQSELSSDSSTEEDPKPKWKRTQFNSGIAAPRIIKS